MLVINNKYNVISVMPQLTQKRNTTFQTISQDENVNSKWKLNWKIKPKRIYRIIEAVTKL